MSKLLILGGPNFIGRHLLTAIAQQTQYEVTLFNRGKTNAHLFPEFNRIIGDRRTDDIQQIQQENWDYVIDLSCYYPASLEQVLKFLPTSVKRYVFVSTVSVYDNEAVQATAPSPEDSTILTCSATEATEELPAAYGNKKVACEGLLAQSGLDFISLRPSLVYGAYDYTDRFYYWLYQVQKHNPILLPDEGKRVCSITYIDDLVQAMLRSLEIKQHSNIYNVITNTQASIASIVQIACDILNKKPAIVNASPNFLHEQEIRQWADLPLWIDNDYFTYSNAKMIEELQIQPSNWEQSIAKTIQHYQEENWFEPKSGMDDKKRLDLLALLSGKS